MLFSRVIVSQRVFEVGTKMGTEVKEASLKYAVNYRFYDSSGRTRTYNPSVNSRARCPLPCCYRLL